jgi:hypothetical protein
MSSKPTPPAEQPAKRTRSPMPADLMAAGRIDQILNALDLDDAGLVLDRANRMFAKRKQLAEKPPHLGPTE